ncbi:MAG: DUF4159 domain-containing protein [Phycisphaerae bacterium]|nr:DUF4159 domain-containing protein [Phycisphaerae bacterium]
MRCIDKGINRRTFLKQAAMATLLGTNASAALSQQAQDQYDLATYDFLIARVQFDSDGRTVDRWNLGPAAESHLLESIQEVLRCKIKPIVGITQHDYYTQPKHLNAIVSFNDVERVCRFPFLLMTSDGSFQFNNRQKMNFKTYVEQGGFIVMDDCVFEDGGDFFFQSGFAMLKELFGSAFHQIPKTHEIFHNVYDMGDIGLPFVQGQRRGAWGVFVGERLAVLLSPGDIHCGWADSDFSWYGPNGKPGCQGHFECIRMGVNLATYAMSH